MLITGTQAQHHHNNKYSTHCNDRRRVGYIFSFASMLSPRFATSTNAAFKTVRSVACQDCLTRAILVKYHVSS